MPRAAPSPAAPSHHVTPRHTTPHHATRPVSTRDAAGARSVRTVSAQRRSPPGPSAQSESRACCPAAAWSRRARARHRCRAPAAAAPAPASFHPHTAPARAAADGAAVRTAHAVRQQRQQAAPALLLRTITSASGAASAPKRCATAPRTNSGQKRLPSGIARAAAPAHRRLKNARTSRRARDCATRRTRDSRARAARRGRHAAGGAAAQRTNGSAPLCVGACSSSDSLSSPAAAAPRTQLRSRARRSCFSARHTISATSSCRASAPCRAHVPTVNASHPQPAAASQRRRTSWLRSASRQRRARPRCRRLTPCLRARARWVVAPADCVRSRTPVCLLRHRVSSPLLPALPSASQHAAQHRPPHAHRATP